MKRLPLACSALYAIASAVFYLFEYRRLIAHHSWTAATLLIAIGLFMTAMAAVMGWLLGRFLREMGDPTENKTRATILAAVVLSLTIQSVWSTYQKRGQAIHYTTLLEDPLTPAQAQAILANGPDEDRSAIAYNKTCPPDVLRALSTSSVLSIRAGVAGNPSTPSEVVDKLAQDPDEMVRRYVDWNPARRAKK